jgi:predicted DNA-binding protein (MmcQ/YjbR family)
LTPAAFDTACRTLPAVTMDVQWGEDHVYKVGGRMFAVIEPDGGCSLKVSDIAFEALVESGQARPAPYLARAKWVRFDNLPAVDGADMIGWLGNAHALVAAKLTRAQRRDLGLG